MGNVDRLRNKVKPFTALFWTLGIVLYLSTPDPARRPGITLPPYTKHVTHAACTVVESWFNSQPRRVAPSPFSNLDMLFIYFVTCRKYILYNI